MPRSAEVRRRTRVRFVRIALVSSLVLYLLSGFKTVQPDAMGFGFLFSQLTRPNLAPGLHWMPPAPFGNIETKRVGYPRKGDVGFRTEMALIEKRRDIRLSAPSRQWHSPVAAMNADHERASYLTGDENLAQMSFSVHYVVSDPVLHFYRTEAAHPMVLLAAEARARELVAAMTLDELITEGRLALEQAILDGTQKRVDALQLGVEITSVHIVDIHPPQDAVFAFRDVSSAREEMETQIHRAKATQSQTIPKARGTAAMSVAMARAQAHANCTLAEGRATAFTDQVNQIAQRKSLLTDLLWLESVERALAGREIFIVPPGTEGHGITLWRESGPAGQKEP